MVLEVSVDKRWDSMGQAQSPGNYKLYIKYGVWVFFAGNFTPPGTQKSQLFSQMFKQLDVNVKLKKTSRNKGNG